MKVNTAMLSKRQFTIYNLRQSNPGLTISAAVSLYAELYSKLAPLMHISKGYGRIVHFRKGLTYCVQIHGAGYSQGNHPNPRIAYQMALWDRRMGNHTAEECEALFWDNMGYHTAQWESWHANIGK